MLLKGKIIRCFDQHEQDELTLPLRLKICPPATKCTKKIYLMQSIRGDMQPLKSLVLQGCKNDKCNDNLNKQTVNFSETFYSVKAHLSGVSGGYP